MLIKDVDKRQSSDSVNNHGVVLLCKKNKNQLSLSLCFHDIFAFSFFIFVEKNLCTILLCNDY